MSGSVQRLKVLYRPELRFDDEHLKTLETYFDFTDKLEDAWAAFALPTETWGEDIFKFCGSLKAICTNTTGISHIDKEAADARGIKIINIESEEIEHVTPTVEHSVGLLLSLMRHTIAANNSAMDGTWARWPYAGDFMLSQALVGIIGYGRLGKRVAKVYRAMGAEVLWSDGPERGSKLGTIASKCQIVSVHVPPGIQVIDSRFCERFQGYLVNTARGEAVDERAVATALASGRMLGYAADVLDGEFEPDFDIHKNPIWNYAQHASNCLITPHIGGSTYDAWRETQRIVIDKVCRLYSSESGVEIDPPEEHADVIGPTVSGVGVEYGVDFGASGLVDGQRGDP